MADSDKNILITPSRGSATADPTIEFTGGDNNPVTLTVLDDGTLSFSGSAGQLFSVSDSLSGTIFSVNDVSGIPSIEVDDDGTVRLAEFAGNVLIGTDIEVDSTYYNTRLQVNGNVKADNYYGSYDSDYMLTPDGTSYLNNIYVTDSATVNGYVQIGETYVYGTDGAGGYFDITTGVSKFSGGIGIGSTTVIDSSRNLTNIGTGSFSGSYINLVNSAGYIRVNNGTGAMQFGSWDGVNHRLESGSDRPMLITAYNSAGVKIGTSGGTTLTVTNGVANVAGALQVNGTTVIDGNRGVFPEHIYIGNVFGTIQADFDNTGPGVDYYVDYVHGQLTRGTNNNNTRGIIADDPTDGQVLSWDNGLQQMKWIAPPAGGGGGSTYLATNVYWSSGPSTGASDFEVSFATEAEAIAFKNDVVNAGTFPGLSVQADSPWGGYLIELDANFGNPSQWAIVDYSPAWAVSTFGTGQLVYVYTANPATATGEIIINT